MFNEELKQRYIQERQSDIIIDPYYLTNKFNEIAEYEAELNKDCNSFTAYEIMDYYKSKNMKVYDTLNVLNSTLALYTEWCIKQNLIDDHQNHYREITEDILQGCLSQIRLMKSIISREEILSLCSELINAKDRFLLLGVFEMGKTDNYRDIINLRMCDVVADLHLLRLCNRTLHVSDNLINYIEQANQEDVYYAPSGMQLRLNRLHDFGYVLKETKSDVDMEDSFKRGKRTYVYIKHMLKYLGIFEWIKPGDIVTSGMIDMIKRESKRRNLSQVEYVRKHFSDVRWTYDRKSLTTESFLRKYGSFLDN